MEDLLTIPAEEQSDLGYKEKKGEEYFRVFKMMEHFDGLIKIMMRKKITDEEEEIEEQYNVGVYRELPYPPNTKDKKDFFVQKN
jgi:hypothetical protein